ncbi:hypothetical protein IV203_007191 [Nitzschia inconspicua]|uniref:Uncharacterized protein n=1 Tax=Nitzschia inconspicua TaxID=303405 RepID=A0A9K3KEZ4_9STRA|nr:hypothetical protein IV203_007191 [Nitzschia inconspicua]
MVDDDPQLVDATVAHPEPSAPAEPDLSSYDEPISTHNDEQVVDTTSLTYVSPATTSETEPGSEADRQMIASGTTAAVFGFLFLGGPLGAVILGCSAAYASQKEGAAGDIARSIGDVGVSIKEKAQQIDNKHHIVDRTSKAATKAWKSAMEYDREHRVLDKILAALQQGWQQLTRFVREHRLLERGVESAGRGYAYVAELTSRSNTTPTSSTENTAKPNTSHYKKIPVTVTASTY